MNNSGKITDKKKRAKKIRYLGSKKDIHEKDLDHLKKTEIAYLDIAKEFPRDFKLIECFKNGKLLPPGIIHQEILSKVEKIL